MQSTLTEKKTIFISVAYLVSLLLQMTGTCASGHCLAVCYQTPLHPFLCLTCLGLRSGDFTAWSEVWKACSFSIDKGGCTHKSNKWIMLSNVIYTEHKYLRHLSLLYFLPQAMAATFLTSPTALCLKWITSFKDCFAEDDCQSETRIIYQKYT